MVGVDPSISLTDVTDLPVELRQKLENQGITELDQLFLLKNKLQDAVTLAKNANLTIRESLEVRHFGRRHFESTLAKITAKRKVEPLELLWKIHWLLGIVPEGDFRKELIAVEASAIATLLENFETTKAPIIERILQILLHRLLIIPNTTRKAEMEQLIEFAEKVQRSSLLAYQMVKAKDTITALAGEKEPTKQIVLLRKLTKHWKALYKTMKERGEEKGKTIIVALQAIDNLKVLDTSEQHLKTRLQRTMTTKKLRQSQLKHITIAMNAMIELRDAYSTAIFAKRGSQIWFELAQGKSSKALGDDLLRSLRFSRTAVFQYRALDDLSRAVEMLDHIIHLIGEIPSEPSELLEEAVEGTLKSLIRTLPLLDRPADQKFIVRVSKRLNTLLESVMLNIDSLETRYVLAKFHVKFQQIALHQLQQLEATPEVSQPLTHELIEALVRLGEMASKEDKDAHLNTAAEYANQLIPEITPTTKINNKDLEVVSTVAQQLAQRPTNALSDSALRLMEHSNQLYEQLYFQTQDSEIKAQLALQLLLSHVSPDSSGQVSVSSPTKDLDKLEDYATTAMLAQVKGRKQVKALKAGSLLVWILLQRISSKTTAQEMQKLKDDARDFTEQTFTFMPAPSQLTNEAYPFAFLLLRNVNTLTHNESLTHETQWEHLLTQCEQLAQTLAKAASEKNDTHNEILALSAAGTATAKLATFASATSSRTRLLRRATIQIQKALQTAAKDGMYSDIEAVLSQYNQLMRARLTVTPMLSTQIPIFEEWNQTYEEGIEALRSSDLEDAVNRLKASKILNAQVPLMFTSLHQGKYKLESVRRQLTKSLHEVNQIGSQAQAQLAQQLERRWAFQVGDDSLLNTGFRLEDTETSFTLADEHFRISLQVEPEIAIDGQTLHKGSPFPYLRPSTKPTELIWYDITPILYSTYEDDKIRSWLALQNPSENSVSIGFWLSSSEDTKATVTLQILAAESLSQGPEGVEIKLKGAKMTLPRQPIAAECREGKGILIYELTLGARIPDTISLNIKIN